MWKTIKSIMGIAMLLGLFFGVYRFLEGHFALASDLQQTKEYAQKVEKRLDFKISDDQRISFKREIREIEERNLGKPIEKWDERDRKRYYELQDQLTVVQDKIKGLI